MTEPAAFELFAFWRSSATFRVRVGLNLKGLAAHEHIVNLEAGEQRGEAFLKINPLGGIPALLVPGHAPITQSLAILEYLEEVKPTPALLPKDSYGRARVRAIAAMLASDTHPLITPRVKKYLTTTGGFDAAAWKAWQGHWFTTGLQAVEAKLSHDSQTGRFAHGDAPTIADICIASILAVTPIFGIEVADIPTVNRIVAECEKVEAFAKAAPKRQVGAPTE